MFPGCFGGCSKVNKDQLMGDELVVTVTVVVVFGIFATAFRHRRYCSATDIGSTTFKPHPPHAQQDFSFDPFACCRCPPPATAYCTPQMGRLLDLAACSASE
jgi:hypothetical protein